MMLLGIKKLIMRDPRIFDLATRIRRRINWNTTDLYRALEAFNKAQNGDVKFIQIGANDGLRNDPIREFAVGTNWKGIFVEPLPDAYMSLISNYSYCAQGRLQFLQAAVAIEDGLLPIYSLSDKYLLTLPSEKRLSLQRKASFSKAHLEKFIDDIQKQYVTEFMIPAVTIDSVLNRCSFDGLTLDLLVMDIEGFESTLIRAIDFERIRPKVFLFESFHMHREEKGLIYRILKDVGYLIADLGLDSIAFQSTAKTGIEEIMESAKKRVV